MTRSLTFFTTVPTLNLSVTHFCWWQRPFSFCRRWLCHCAGIRTFFRFFLITWGRGTYLILICEIGFTVIRASRRYVSVRWALTGSITMLAFFYRFFNAVSSRSSGRRFFATWGYAFLEYVATNYFLAILSVVIGVRDRREVRGSQLKE